MLKLDVIYILVYIYFFLLANICANEFAVFIFWKNRPKIEYKCILQFCTSVFMSSNIVRNEKSNVHIHGVKFLSPSNPSHEHLTLNVEHTILLFIQHTYIYNIYFFFSISNLHMSDLYTHDCLYCIVFLLFCTLPICILFFYYLCLVLLLSFCCTVELLSLEQIPRVCKHTWPIKLILILILILNMWKF